MVAKDAAPAAATLGEDALNEEDARGVELHKLQVLHGSHARMAMALQSPVPVRAEVQG